jgi:biotin carboxyl carrier protein
MRLVATVNGRAEMVEVTGRDGRYRLAIGEQVIEVDARRIADGLYSLLVDGISHVADVSPGKRGTRVDIEGATYHVEVEEHARHVIRTRGGAGATGGTQTITAPLPGKITHVAVAPGDRVERGDTVVVIEAMKMENEFKAAAAGVVTEVRVQPGQPVNPGDVLVVIGVIGVRL